MTFASVPILDQSGESPFSAFLTAVNGALDPLCSFAMICLIVGVSSSLWAPAGREVQPTTARKPRTVAAQINDRIRYSLIGVIQTSRGSRSIDDPTIVGPVPGEVKGGSRHRAEPVDSIFTLTPRTVGRAASRRSAWRRNRVGRAAAGDRRRTGRRAGAPGREDRQGPRRTGRDHRPRAG